jgi:hypothetical protein
MKGNSSLGTELRLPTSCQKQQISLANTRNSDKITLVFDLECATLFPHIDERKIHPVRVTEVILLRVSTLLPALKRGLKICLLWFGLVLVFFVCVFSRVSNFRASVMVFTSTNRRVFYKLTQGPSREISFPRPGPFDERKGYSKLPVFQTG